MLTSRRSLLISEKRGSFDSESARNVSVFDMRQQSPMLRSFPQISSFVQNVTMCTALSRETDQLKAK